MEGFDLLKNLLSLSIQRLPYFIVLIIGLIISISRYQRFPKVSRLSIIAFSILLLLHLISIFFPLLTVRIYQATNSHTTVGYVTFAFGTAVSIISAAAFGLLIYAMWTDRDRS